MAWLCVDMNGKEYINESEPVRCERWWNFSEEICVESEIIDMDLSIELPEGTIFKILGRVLTWLDEPVEIK